MALWVFLCAVPTVALGISSVWILFRFTWIKGFLIGVLGLGLCAGAVLLGLASWSLSLYQPAPSTTFLGTITVRDQAPQHYAVTVAQDRLAMRYDLTGDLWRAVAVQYEVPRWVVVGQPIPAVKLKRIEARFLMMEDELEAQRPSHDESWFMRLGDWMLGQIFPQQELYTPLLPLTMQSIFSLELQGDRLVLQGVNEPAQEALRR